MCLFDIITPPQKGPLSPSTAPLTLEALTRAATQGQSCIVVSFPPIILFRMWEFEETPHPAGLSKYDQKIDLYYYVRLSSGYMKRCFITF